MCSAQSISSKNFIAPMQNKSPYEQLIWNGIGKAQDPDHQAPADPHRRPSSEALPPPLKIKIFIGSDCKVHVTPSSKTVSTILARLPGSEYNIGANEWSFHVEHHDAVTRELAGKAVFDKIPQGTLMLARKEFKTTQHNLEGGIYDMLMSFQRQAVDFAINRNGRVLLGDDMGLGKTIQALSIANYYMTEYPLLILSPASLCHNWMDSVQMFLGEESIIVKEKDDFRSRIAIVSYNLAVSLIDAIVAQRYSVIICDECHYLKSMTSKRTRLLLPVLQRSPRLVMISGTPATSRPLELYPILCALDKTVFPSFPVYGNRYCDGKKMGMHYDYRGCSNAAELSTIIEKAFMVRRTKDSVMSELPLKSRRQVLIDVKRASEALKKTEKVIGEHLDTQVMQEYREAAGLKKDSVTRYLGDILEKNVKCIVFGHHKEMLDALEEFCESKLYRYIRIDGTTVASKRHSLVESYQSDESVRVAVLSLTACCTGLTLTAGKAVIFAELYWNPGTMLQAEDRVHRIGQKDNVDIHYLVARKTIDEVVWPKLLKKLNVLESLGMSRNDLKLVRSANADDPVQGRLNFKRTM